MEDEGATESECACVGEVFLFVCLKMFFLCVCVLHRFICQRRSNTREKCEEREGEEREERGRRGGEEVERE